MSSKTCRNYKSLSQDEVGWMSYELNEGWSYHQRSYRGFLFCFLGVQGAALYTINEVDRCCCFINQTDFLFGVILVISRFCLAGFWGSYGGHVLVVNPVNCAIWRHKLRAFSLQHKDFRFQHLQTRLWDKRLSVIIIYVFIFFE